MKNWRKPENIKQELFQECTFPWTLILLLNLFLRLTHLCRLRRTLGNAIRINSSRATFSPRRLFHPNNRKESFFTFTRFRGFLIPDRRNIDVMHNQYSERLWNARQRIGHNVFYYRFTSIFISPKTKTILAGARSNNKNFIGFLVFYFTGFFPCRNNLWKAYIGLLLKWQKSSVSFWSNWDFLGVTKFIQM